MARTYKLNIFPAFILIAITFFIATTSQAQKAPPSGYILTKNNDTIRCTFKLPVKRNGTFYVFEEVTIGSTDNEIVYKATDKRINGFGFSLDSLHYNYILKTENDTSNFFMLRMAHGARLNLYYRFFYPDGVLGKASAVDVYMLEDSAKNSISFAGEITMRSRRKAKDFLAKSPELAELFDIKVKYLNDMKSFVMAANKL
jgi:hypothetical protein